MRLRAVNERCSETLFLCNDLMSTFKSLHFNMGGGGRLWTTVVFCCCQVTGRGSSEMSVCNCESLFWFIYSNSNLKYLYSSCHMLYTMYLTFRNEQYAVSFHVWIPSCLWLLYSILFYFFYFNLFQNFHTDLSFYLFYLYLWHFYSILLNLHFAWK